MFLSIRKKYWFYLIATLILVGLMAFLQLSPVFAVKQIELEGSFAENLDDITDECLLLDQNLFRFDRKKLANSLLTRDDIVNARLSLSLPHGIRGEINSFEPAALIMTDRLYALDRHCRLIPYDSSWTEVSLPILTGLKTTRLFKSPDDYRVAEVVAGLTEIKNETPELYRQIAEIDFSDHVYVSIYLTTGTDRYLAGSRNFVTQLIKLDVVHRSVARSDDGCYNLMYDGVVIKQR